jgi:predicted  nucleic acid-binding Zn-ribbon protein
VHNKLQLLLKLQKVDDTLRQTLKKNQDLPRKIQELGKNLEDDKAAFETSQMNLKQATREQHKLEKELNESIDQLKKKQSRVFEIKTNEEYKALLKEIEYTKQIHSEMEDRILHMFDDIENLEKETRHKEKALKIIENNTRKEIELITKEIASIKQELEELEKERLEICQKLNPELLSQYEILRQRRSGLAVVVIQQEICPGCHLYIPPQTINEVLQTGEIRQCPHCRRILYCEMEDEKMKSSI